MADSRGCRCLSSLWGRITGRAKTQGLRDGPVSAQVQTSPPPPQGGTSRAGSLYAGLRDFAGGGEHELSFQKGDRFKVLGRSEEWWTVQRLDQDGNGRGSGNVPYDLLERIEPLDTQPWFFGTMSRSEAEALLMGSENERGAFLLRRSESESVGYVLSVKSWSPVRHFKVLQDQDGNYCFESSENFTSLVDLVDHFLDRGLEGVGSLGEPCRKKRPEVPEPRSESELEFSAPLQDEPGFEALWDFDARRPEELSCQRGDSFKVLGRGEAWWKVQRVDPDGECGGAGLVPANHLGRSESEETQAWYFGTLTRSEAEAVLKSPENDNGAFLIRRSDRDAVGYVLSVSTPVSHFKVQKNKENNYSLEQSPVFRSLGAMVQHYGLSSLGSMGKLRAACQRPLQSLSDDRPDILAQTDSSADSQTAEAPLSSWETDRGELVFEEALGNGSFADVYRGTWRKSTSVAVKVIREEHEVDAAVFRREIERLVNLRHSHLVPVLAACTDSPPFYIVMDLMEEGSLLDFLRGPEAQYLEPVSLADMAAQVADGMSHLEDHSIVHGELGARNVLLGDGFVCKVSDFGLGFIKEAFYKTDELRYPSRWSAPEVFTTKKVSHKSDVWSFGVFLYEVFSMGGVPYSAISTREILTTVTSGYRMPRPPKCPPALYDVMTKCWSDQPEDRPTFGSLRARLKDQEESADEEDA